MRIVMTGATSGIGLAAAQAMIARADVSMVIGTRHPDKLPTLLHGRVTAMLLDLDDLASVARFADAVRADGPINALVCNAGLQLNRPQRSAQGFERSFAVNHLALKHSLPLNGASEKRCVMLLWLLYPGYPDTVYAVNGITVSGFPHRVHR